MTATASAGTRTRLEASADLDRTDPPHDAETATQFARLLELMAQDDFSGVREPAEAILARGGRTLRDDALSGALTALAFVAWEQGRVRDACGLLRASIRRADGGSAAALRVYPQLALGAMLTAVGEFGEAETMIARGRKELESAETKAWAGAPTALRARLLLVEGRLDEAVAEAETALAIAQDAGRQLFVPLAVSTIASAALLRGDLDEAARRVDQCHDTAAERMGFGWGNCFWIKARIVEARHGAPAAVDAASPIYDDVAVHTCILVEEPAAAAWLVRLALAAGDVPKARKVIACSEQIAADNEEVASVEMAAIHARGLFEREPAALARAATDHRHPWARALASEDLGAVLSDESAPGASAQLERALASYEHAGADGDARRIREKARLVNAPRRNGRPLEGWGSLTATERRVARNVADGMTNRKVGESMHLSPHTVDVHLRHMYRKLNIRSRVELTRIVLRRAKPGRAAHRI
jgi:ATP/maltotriose-dependent transcriptional regulator MalT